MDVSGLEKARQSSIKKRIAYLVGVALAGAAMAAMGIPGTSHYTPSDGPQDTGIAIERRLQRLEQSDARTQESIHSIKDDTHYLRDRLDHFIDSQKERR